jgi:polysaccharide export outer membrane protein
LGRGRRSTEDFACPGGQFAQVDLRRCRAGDKISVRPTTASETSIWWEADVSKQINWSKTAALGLVAALSLSSACVAAGAAPAAHAAGADETPDYQIGIGDHLQVFVWKNPELSAEVPVRPDGKITTPLAPDIQAQGKTPSEVAAILRVRLANYIQEPVVTVLVKSVAAPANAAAIRVIGAAATPKTVSYRAGITALDVLIEAGGLNTFANGDGATLLRKENGVYRSYPLHLSRLVKAGDLQSNVAMMPGDVIRIPERWF